MNTYLGIDIGTSATKAVLCDDHGRVLVIASSPHSIQQPHAGWSEQRPEMWWDAAVLAVREILRQMPTVSVAAVGLSGQMHGSVFLPKEAINSGGEASAASNPLRPALLWNDQRTSAECEEIERAFGGREATVRLVGNAALTGFTAPKVLWLRKHEPDTYERVAAICLPKDFIALRLTGVLATDVGDASGTLLFDPFRRTWCDRACQRLGIDPALLPPVYESATRIGSVTPWAASQTGLPAGTPVIIGSGDNMTSAIGSGIAEEGMVAAALGTSGVIIAHADSPVIDAGSAHADSVRTLAAAIEHRSSASRLAPAPSCEIHLNTAFSGRTHTMCSATGAWCVTGCMLSAGGSLKWCRDTLFPGVSYDALMTEAAAVPPGSGGLIFLPYLTGERCPHPDPHARGGWIGLTSRHTRGHLVRAVIEGVSFSMGQILDIVRSLGVDASRVRVSGGGANSPFWRQMLADVFQCPVATTNTQEGPAHGAAILASVGAGHYATVGEACKHMIAEVNVHTPGEVSFEAYGKARAVFAELYGDLQCRFSQLAAIDR